jgi:hypothetical protein
MPKPKEPNFVPSEEKRRTGGKGSGCGGCLAVIIVILLAITAGVYLLLVEVKFPGIPVSEEKARNVEIQIKRLELSSQRGQAIEISVTDEEINSYLKKGFTTQGIDKVRSELKEWVDLEDIEVRLEGDQMQVWLKIYYKFKRVSINMTGRIETIGNKVDFIPQVIKVGKISIPVKFSTSIAGLLRKDSKDFSYSLPSYVEKVLIINGKMIVKGKISK